MKIKLLKASVYGPGKMGNKGATITVPDKVANQLLMMERAVLIEEKKPETKGKAS